MKRIITMTVLGLFGYTTTHAQCVETPVNKVLLAGDSWAAFMYGDQTINQGLRNVGHSDKRFVSNVVISENGADTWDFVDGPKQDAIQDFVDANPEISIIHMSIGGNDMLGDWNISFSQQQTDSLAQDVKGRLDSIVDFLQGTRAGMNVFWPGYTYPNFEEVIEEIAPFQSNHPFYSTWNDMGQPNFLQINTVLNEMSDSVAFSASIDPQLHFVSAQGVLQYHFGQAQALGVAPGGTYPAFDAPLPLGYPDYPSPKESMRLYAGIFTDCFHLSPAAYLVFFQYQAEAYYQEALMDDLFAYSEGGNTDGTVSSSGTVSQDLMIGEDAGSELATVLTFDVQGMADTTLSSVSIFLKRKELTGADPMDEDIQVKLVNGYFGTSADVEAGDFMESGVVDGYACVFGSHEEDDHWVRLNLTAEMLANINNQNQIQLMISAPGFTGGKMSFYGPSEGKNSPKINLNYGPEPNSVREIREARELPVYPIPTAGELTIDVNATDLLSVEVMNIMGEVVLAPQTKTNRIDISELPVGSYILRITTKEGISAKRIIKR